MADGIKFMYPEMRDASTKIKEIAGKYKSAASSFESDFTAAISGWEGKSKDAVQNFVSGPVMEYIRDNIPKLLEALADLLTGNADQMESADEQIAENIPKSLG